MAAAKEQHKDPCNILQGASVTLHIILLGVGGTIYNTHTLNPFKELGLDSQRATRFPPSSMCTLWTLLLNWSIPDVPFPVILSTLIRSRFQAKPATSWSPLIFPFLRGGGALQGVTRGYKEGLQPESLADGKLAGETKSTSVENWN